MDLNLCDNINMLSVISVNELNEEKILIGK